MAYNEETYSGSTVAAVNLQQIEDNWAYLRTNFAGASSPANPNPGQLWADTGNDLLKIRDDDNAAWLAMFNFDTGKIADDAVVAARIDSLTATIAEINKACDGISATAAEINTCCDGSTAKNDHIHDVSLAQNNEVIMSSGLKGGTGGATGWHDLRDGTWSGKYYIYVPSDAQYMRCKAYAKHTYYGPCYLRLVVGGTNGTQQTLSDAYSWEDSRADVSSLNGWYEVHLEGYCSYINNEIYVDVFSLYWSDS